MDSVAIILNFDDKGLYDAGCANPALPLLLHRNKYYVLYVVVLTVQYNIVLEW